MQAQFEKLDLPDNQSFRIHQAVHPYFMTPWHFHPEYELLLIEKSSGTRMVGNHLERFEPGDLVFIASNLPHVWKNDKAYYKANSRLTAHATVIHFMADFWQEVFSMLPECKQIKRLFEYSRQGIKFLKPTRQHLAKQIKMLKQQEGFSALLNFIVLLQKMAETDDYELLASPHFSLSVDRTDCERFKRVIDYTMKHFTEHLSLQDVSEQANLTPTAFCRYFKQRTQKSFTQFLTSMRVSYACKLLIESQMPVTQIAYESGFRNQSNFNQQFKAFTKQTPGNYRRQARGR